MDKTQAIQTGLSQRTHADKFDASLHHFVDQMRILAMGPMLANKKMRDTLEEACNKAKTHVASSPPFTDLNSAEIEDFYVGMCEFYHAVRCAINDNDSADADTAARIKQMGRD